MNRKVILLSAVFSFVVAGVTACANLSEMKGGKGTGSPELPNSLGTPLSMDLRKHQQPRVGSAILLE